MSDPVYGWVTVAEADTYFATRWGAGDYWASGTDKEGALQTGYNDLAGCGLFAFPASASDAMKRAQFEQALFVAIHGEDADRRLGLRAQGVTRADVVGESYGGPVGIAISPRARGILDAAGYGLERGAYAVELERDDNA